MKKRYLAMLLAIAIVFAQTVGTGQVVLAAQIAEEEQQGEDAAQEKEGEIEKTEEEKTEGEETKGEKIVTGVPETGDKKEDADEEQNDGDVLLEAEEKKDTSAEVLPEEEKEADSEKSVSVASLPEDGEKAGESTLQLNFWGLGDIVAEFPDTICAVSKEDSGNCYDDEGNTYPIVVTAIVSENENIVSVKEEETEWLLQLKNPGKTNITISCCMKDDPTKTFEKKIQVNVRSDLYFMNIVGGDRTINMLYGDSIDLTADIRGEYQDENGDVVSIDAKDLKIEWEYEVDPGLEDGTEIGKNVKLEPDAANPAKCRLTVGEAEYSYTMEVRAKAFKDGDEVATADVHINVNDYYDVIEPAIDTNILPGESVEIQNLCAYRYEQGKEKVKKGDRISFEFDPELFEIKKGEEIIESGEENKQEPGGNYTLKRLKATNAEIQVYSWAQGENGEWELSASDNWTFDDNYYGIVCFEEDYYEGYASDNPEENDVIDMKLNTESIKTEHTIEWTVGLMDEAGDFEQIIDESNYTASGNVLNLDANRLKKALKAMGKESEYLYVSVCAVVKIGGVEATRAYSDATIKTPKYELEDVWDKTEILNSWLFFSKKTSCYVQNKKYPDGNDIPVTLSDIVIQQKEKVWEKSEEDSEIILKAVGCGEAVVTFKTQSEELGDKDFTVNMSVTDDMYQLIINDDSDFVPLLSGKSHKLNIEVVHRYYDSKSGEIKEEPVKDPSSYLTYHDFNTDFISVNDGTITAKPLAEEPVYIDVRVHLSVPRDGRDNFECDQQITVYVTNRYYRAVVEKMYVEPGETVSLIPVKLLRFDAEHENGIEEKGFRYKLSDEWNVTLNKEKTGFTVNNDLDEGEILSVGITVEKIVDDEEIAEYVWMEMEVCRHNFIVKSTKQDNCTAEGVKTLECSKCHTVRTETIPKTSHSFGAWQTTREATVFAQGAQVRTCSRCRASETRTLAKLKPFIKLNAKTIPLKVKQSTTAVKVTMEKGDSIASWKSSNKKIATVNSKGKITGKKAGTAKITVTLKSGVKATIKVKVQKKAVTTSKISVTGKTSKIGKKLTLKKGKSATLAVTVTPITSKEKVTYKSSNKKVAAVTSKGKITAKKPGKAKITVKSGKKKVVITVTVKK